MHSIAVSLLENTEITATKLYCLSIVRQSEQQAGPVVDYAEFVRTNLGEHLTKLGVVQGSQQRQVLAEWFGSLRLYRS